jgi:radical SAM superfamily enzyme YgiQ (UPF0313 family)
MSAKVRARYPDLPIVWGGTHPSIAPEQTCEHPLVDIVVAGQGEATFMELVEAIEAGRPLDEVDGLYFKRDGRIVKTGCRATVDIDTLPPLPFEVFDVERSITLHAQALDHHLPGRRPVTYYSSYGCPFSCSFCSEPLTSKRRWYSKSPEKVIADLKTLKERYGADAVIFEDPIYFIDLKRAVRIAELMIENDLEMMWTASSRLETIKKIDDETWELLKRSGLFQIFIGIESASPTVLKSIGKKYTADDIVEIAKIFYEKGVTLTGSFIQGIPVEAEGRSFEEIQREDMRITAQTILRVAQVNPKAALAVGLYTPYPGSVSYHLSIKHGFEPPDKLEGWRTFNHRSNQVPWVLPEQEHFSKSSKLALKALRGGKDLARWRRKKSKAAVFYAYSLITRARFRHGYFKYAYEQKLVGKLAHRIVAQRQQDKERQINGYVV